VRKILRALTLTAIALAPLMATACTEVRVVTPKRKPACCRYCGKSHCDGRCRHCPPHCPR